MPVDEMQACLAGCYPLHPLTALVLGPLFRQLAQNERPLFAFLASIEPFGFQEFLQRQTVADGAYRLDCLYDYVLASLGPGCGKYMPCSTLLWVLTVEPRRNHSWRAEQPVVSQCPYRQH